MLKYHRNTTLKTGQDCKFYFMYVLPQLKKKIQTLMKDYLALFPASVGYVYENFNIEKSVLIFRSRWQSR